ncbi:MocR-like pyridoxine biosynthesis transcription factor PdxR [Amycolatopsis acidiphila]|uniref:MocR-like pyridoxine biosynthesis transcription factor PdxR n=1 Tax=Amycolatopsis acidiphila TaxID=715473 RepID=UPI001C946CA4|nr:PLP-dependent aminotransferase family protein [Amycolatopsis acidiphila]
MALLIALRREARIPLHRQIEASVRDAIRAGTLVRGSALPPTRVLAADLGVSRGVVVEAYQQLTAEGYLSGRVGGHTEVAAGAAPRPVVARIARPQPARIDLSYGRADVSSFPRAAWLRAIRGALNDAPNELFGYLSGSGVPQLRVAIADYLNRVRGTVADPARIVICTGYAQGIALLIQVLAAAGVRRLALEDPSSGDDALPIVAAAGLDVVGIPVDGDGIRVDLLRESDADAVILTPSHQWPTGAVLTPENRAAVLEGASARGGVVIEDDYDAEYRYDRTPIGAMQGLAPEHVVYAGSASKALAPGLRLGWFLVPSRLAGPMAEAKIAADRGSPALEQLALADLITRGEFDRHLRRMRPVYRRRRDALLTALSRRLPALVPTGVSAGLHLMMWLPAGAGRDRDRRGGVPGRGRRRRRRPVPHRHPGTGWPHLRLRRGRRTRRRRGRRHHREGHRRPVKDADGCAGWMGEALIGVHQRFRVAGAAELLARRLVKRRART